MSETNQALASLMPHPEALQNFQTVADMMRARNLAPYQQRQLQAQTQGIQTQTRGEELKNQVTQQSLTDANLFMQGMKQKGDPMAALDWAKDNGMSGQGYMSHIATVQQMVKGATDLQKDQLALHQGNYEAGWNTAQNFQDLPAEKQTPEAYQNMLADLEKYEPGISAEVQNKPQGQAVDSIISHFGTGKWVAERALAEQKSQEEAWKEIPGTGMMVNVLSGARIGAGLGNIDSLNSELTARWQVLHPGEALPKEFVLPKDASPLDYQRIDKNLTAMESTQATQSQREQTNAIRQQTLELAQDKAHQNPVVGKDAEGRDVLVNEGDAKDLGLKNIMKAPEQDVERAIAARHWIPLATKQAKPAVNPDGTWANPEEFGILPLVDHLAKEGKLGVVASRWNDFMANKVGAGDPEYVALKDKLGLSTTLLMNAHVGSRGGAFLLEHFEDLANAKKLDADSLRTAIKSELNYIQDRAMLPGGSKETQSAGNPTPQTHSVSLAAGLKKPGATEAAVRAWAKQKGYDVTP